MTISFRVKSCEGAWSCRRHPHLYEFYYMEPYQVLTADGDRERDKDKLSRSKRIQDSSKENEEVKS